VNLFEQLRNLPPTELMRHLCANIEINAGNKQLSSPIHQARDIPITIFCSRALLLRTHELLPWARFDNGSALAAVLTGLIKSRCLVHSGVCLKTGIAGSLRAPRRRRGSGISS